ncbi:MAG: TVP38/TMEM64 family protein [Erysipelotrichaceae bacterium]|nr:TVP38/TMEM64 family protein [Erysipelotrichaceae bacterium]
MSLTEIYGHLTDLEWWAAVLEEFRSLGPLMPILLAYCEAFLPVLPMVGIVALNVAMHGMAAGLLYSWTGSVLGCICVFSFFRLIGKRCFEKKRESNERVARADAWIRRLHPGVIFLLIMMPFTPSCLVNLTAGLSSLDPKKYFLILLPAKAAMLASLAYFSSSLIDIREDPLGALIAAGLMIAFYLLSRYLSKRYELQKLEERPQE